MTGYMDLTGEPDGPPTLCGVPFIDLKAGDEVFSSVCLALAEKAETGRGKRIDVSMAQAAASWLVTTIPLLDLGYEPHELRRSGSEHREFVPVNVYPTSDGFIYLAIGNDVQWKRLVSVEAFSSLGSSERATNEGRKREREAIHRDLGAITRRFSTNDLVTTLAAAGLVAAPVQTVSEMTESPPIRDALLETQTSGGRRVRLPPPSVETEHLASVGRQLPYAPAYGQDTDKILLELGCSANEIAVLKESGTVR
jgi:crotonobetainyl-CoA:carnitine CoA-transferase CaiB-like acyl-CoA transferase